MQSYDPFVVMVSVYMLLVLAPSTSRTQHVFRSLERPPYSIMDTFSPHRLGTVVTKMLTQLYTYDNGSSTISRGATAMLLFLWHVAVREGGGNYADMDLR